MMGSYFSYFTQDQTALLKEKTFDLLENQGVKLDEHPEMLELLSAAGAAVDAAENIVRFPKKVMTALLAKAPTSIILGARSADRVLILPKPGGGFYGRTCTGAHGWIEPDTGAYRKVVQKDLTEWARLINHLDDIHFLPFLYADDVPAPTADIHGLFTLLANTDKHVWIQPYSQASVPYLLKMAEAAAGGAERLKANPVASVIACSLTPRTFKTMDLEIILQSARAGVPIHACSLPGAGGTAPATGPGVILLAAVEILAMTAMAQAVQPGAPVVACPIIFATDMRTGRSLQTSVDAMRGASGAVQFLKKAFHLPTHNYGTGTDANAPGAASQTQRTLLSALMALSGSDILGGAGQLEVATAVSPLQLIIDNEVFASLRHLASAFVLDDDQLACDVITETPPGGQFLTSPHTFRHCRDGFVSSLLPGEARESWMEAGQKDLLDVALERYRDIAGRPHVASPPDNIRTSMESILNEADNRLNA